MTTVRRKKDITFHLSKDQQDRLNDARTMEASAKAIRKELITEAEKHPDIFPIKRAFGFQDEIGVELLENGPFRFRVTLSVVEEITEDKAPPATKPPEPTQTPKPVQIFMDPKTLNSLLHGRLLSDAQKVELVNRVYPGLDFKLPTQDDGEKAKSND